MRRINESRDYHKKIPRLSTCDVARKSFVGENDTLVAMLEVRNMSIRRPVGTSNVRMIESIDVVTSHLESGEKVYRIARVSEKSSR